jgi:ABC-2 type transport system permease protein
MNLSGLKTLFLKEVRRFLRVPGQTVLSPLISTTLYFVVFGVSLGGRMEEVTGQPYIPFIVPGLIFLGLANNAFLNTSSSLGPWEVLLGFVGGGMVRGLAVGLLTWVVALLFAPLQLAHPAVTLLFLLGTAYVFSVLGLIAAVWAEKFEQINFFPTFVMLPLTFLGGVFYSIARLPDPWRTISHFNPMVYMVEGLRYGILGSSAFPPLLGGAILLALAAASTAITYGLLASGYKLKQ